MFKTFGWKVCASRKTRENLYSASDVFFLMVAGEKEAQPCAFFLDCWMNDGLDVDPMLKESIRYSDGLAGTADNDRDYGKTFGCACIEPRFLCQR